MRELHEDNFKSDSEDEFSEEEEEFESDQDEMVPTKDYEQEDENRLI